MIQTSTNEKLATATKSDPGWPLILNRDPAADGQFYYSVQPPCVCCRPA